MWVLTTILKNDNYLESTPPGHCRDSASFRKEGEHAHTASNRNTTSWQQAV